MTFIELNYLQISISKGDSDRPNRVQKKYISSKKHTSYRNI